MTPPTAFRRSPVPVRSAQVLLVVAALVLIRSAWLFAVEVQWRQRTGEGEFLYLALLHAGVAAVAITAVTGLGRRRRWAPPAGLAVVVLALLLDPVWPLLDPQGVRLLPPGLARSRGGLRPRAAGQPAAPGHLALV